MPRAAILEFRWWKELTETKQSLKMEGSKIRLNGELKRDKQELEKELMKEKEKNEWLLQLKC